MDYTIVSASDFASMGDMTSWRYGDRAIRAEFVAGSYTAAGQLAAEIAAAADAAGHHPDLSIEYPGRLGVVLTTHAAGDLTTLDIDLARQVDALASAAGARVD